ncbi:MAG: ARMT1-like domain-containing protein [candidate division WOR-3 bacterium]
MRSEANCIPCVIRQAQRIVLFSKGKEEDFINVTKLVMDMVGNLSLEDPPSIFTSYVIREVYNYLKNPDPFLELKKEMNRIGKKRANEVRLLLEKEKDKIYGAIKYAACGNIIDIGPQNNFDLEQHIKNLFFKRDDYKIFKEKLKGANKILYVLDNAGEIYFDRLLLEQLSFLKLVIVVKKEPILNDATIKDAKEAELDKLGEIIDTGSGFLGVNFNEVSTEFLKNYQEADIVIAKGHANYESLVDKERDAFFILKAKCPVVAKSLGVEIGDSVFYYYPGKEEIV